MLHTKYNFKLLLFVSVWNIVLSFVPFPVMSRVRQGCLLSPLSFYPGTGQSPRSKRRKAGWKMWDTLTLVCLLTKRFTDIRGKNWWTGWWSWKGETTRWMDSKSHDCPSVRRDVEQRGHCGVAEGVTQDWKGEGNIWTTDLTSQRITDSNLNMDI